MSTIAKVADDREAAVRGAVEALQAGDLVVLPTDTLYGLVADAFNPAATAKLFRAKKRSRGVPLSVLIRSPKQLLGLVTSVPEEAERLMAAYWPGPLTIVVPHDPHLQWDLGDAAGTVAVRMPFDEVTLEVIRSVGPVACSTANLAGSRPCATAEAARDQLGDAVAVYVADGARSGLAASTIIDLTRDQPYVLRDGPIPGTEALEVARGERSPMDVTVVAGPAVAAASAAEDDADTVVVDAPSGAAAAPEDAADRLASVPGVGPAKVTALLDRFGSAEAVAAAPVEELVQVPGVGPALAQRLRDALG